MTAVNVIVEEGGHQAHLLTDGAHYDDDGRLTRIASKVRCLEGCADQGTPAVVACRGGFSPRQVIAWIVNGEVRTFDDLVKYIGEELPRCGPKVFAEHPYFESTWEVFLVGWSKGDGRVEAFVVTPDEETAASFGATPWALAPIHSAFFAPLVSAEQLATIGRCLPAWTAHFFPETDGRLLLELQRATRWQSKDPSSPFLHRVGGFAELTTVSRLGVEKRFLGAWPDDRVGELISPGSSNG